MIALDGISYNTFQLQYAKKPIKLGSTGRGLLGNVIRVEAGAFQTEYDITLLLNPSEVDTLRTSFAKASPSNQLSLVDEEGDTSAVYFILFQEPKPLSVGRGYSANQFTSQVGLIATDVVAAATDRLITDLGDYIITDDGDYLIWDS